MITLVIIALIALSPFLPGPSFLNEPAQFFFSAAQVLSLIGLLVLPVGLWLTIREIRRKIADKQYSFRLTPLFVFAIPLTLIICMFLGDTMRNISRSIAIRRANKIVAAIELYKREHKTYPTNLTTLQPKYLKSIPATWVIGIPGYGYQNLDSTFNLTFGQNVLFGFNFEIVTYNPLDKQKADGELQELYETGDKHWKYYIFD